MCRNFQLKGGLGADFIACCCKQKDSADVINNLLCPYRSYGSRTVVDVTNQVRHRLFNTHDTNLTNKSDLIGRL